MKRLLATAATAFLLLGSPPVQAAFYPNIYADEYCRLRRFGVSFRDAMAAAALAAFHTGYDPDIRFGNRIAPASVVRTSIAVAQLCPEYAIPE